MQKTTAAVATIAATTGEAVAAIAENSAAKTQIQQLQQQVQQERQPQKVSSKNKHLREFYLAKMRKWGRKV